MKRFVEGEDRLQGALLPRCLDDYVTENNPVRIIEAFIDELDLGRLGFGGVVPKTTGRPAYHPATLLKTYLYGYLNRIPSSRRLERETQRNIELMLLTRDPGLSAWITSQTLRNLIAKIGLPHLQIRFPRPPPPLRTLQH